MHFTLTAMIFTHSYCCCHYLFPLLNNDRRYPLHWCRHLYSDWSGLCPHYRYQHRLTHHSDVILMGHGSAGCTYCSLPPVILLWMTLTLHVFLLLPVTLYICHVFCTVCLQHFIMFTLKNQPALCAIIPFTLVFDGSCLHDFSPSLCQ